MSNRMKLVPLEPTNKMLEDTGSMNNYDIDHGTGDKDHREWFRDVTSESPTVEVVDEETVFNFLTDIVKKKYGTDVMLLFTPCMARMNGLLHENGYQIIKKLNK